MTALYIIGGILLFILILLYIPVTVDMSYLNKKFTLRVKYLIFTLYSIPAAPKKKKRKKKPKARKKTDKNKKKVSSADDKKTKKKPAVTEAEEKEDITLTEEKKPEAEAPSDEDKELLTGKKDSKKSKSSEKEEKEPLSDKLALVKELMDKCLKYIMKIIKDIAVKKIRLDIVVGTPDAYKTAMDYGKINAAVWSAVGIMQSVMRKKFSAKHIKISADFLSEKTKISASARVTITPAVVLGNLIVAGVKALGVLKKHKREREDAGKDSACEKKAA